MVFMQGGTSSDGKIKRNVGRQSSWADEVEEQQLTQQKASHTGSQTEKGAEQQQGEGVSASHQKVIQGRHMEDNLLVNQGKKSKNTAISVGAWVTPASKSRQQVVQGNSFEVLEELVTESVMQMPRISPRKEGDIAPYGYG
ncbi:hypothetical protein HAX54_047819 [Datura stramonium]|uniref:Uncharacterized protein n=1 Tax=Datura stramonium TaxID=4076 RepID=A0ABS8STG2_DATST|nr:hypothetical protein [Datura stramonium]